MAAKGAPSVRRRQRAKPLASPGGAPAGVRSRTLSVLALGFRPFYLLAAAFAALAVPAWLLAYTGRLPATPGLHGVLWHLHEMLFGFAPAVIAGFLLTAVRNWSGQPTATGKALGALVLLWAAARVLLFTGPIELAAAVDSAFLPALGVAIAAPIWRSRNRRNVKVIGVVAALGVLNVLFHLAHLGIVSGTWLTVSYTTGLDIVALLIAIMAGRVIPAFTANAIAEANPRRFVSIEAMAVGTLVLIVIADLAGRWWRLPQPGWATLLAIAAAAHVVRLAFWSPLRSRHDVLLFMLPMAYAWLPIYLALRALGALGLVATVAGTHALTIGAMAGLMVAMMMRSALGHTGRALGAGKAETTIFVLIQLAALIRVIAAAWIPDWQLTATLCSGLLWTLGFLILLLAYWPKLTRPRIDGKPG